MQILLGQLAKNGIKEYQELISDNIDIFLKKSAIDFLNQVLLGLQQRQHYLLVFGNQIIGKYENLYKKISKDQELVRQLAAAQEKFQLMLNIANKTTVGLVYMNSETGEIVATSEKAMIDFISANATYNRGRVNIGLSPQNIIKTLENQDKDWDNLSNILNRRSRMYYSVLQESFYRYSNQDMQYKQHNAKLKNTFYWWPQDRDFFPLHRIQWSKPYGNTGKISEGYIHGLFKNAFLPGGKFSLEDNLFILAVYANMADNIGASVQQDLVFNINRERIEFAIKTNKFSTARMGQYIQQAFSILNIDQAEIKKILNKDKEEEKIKISLRKIIEYINKKEEDTLNKVQQILKQQ